MFSYNSRYSSIQAVQLTTADGRKITFLPRRFLPQGKTLPLMEEVKVKENDRLDLIAYESLGDPEKFWQVCDSNDAMNPMELIQEPGKVLRISEPQM